MTPSKRTTRVGFFVVFLATVLLVVNGYAVSTEADRPTGASPVSTSVSREPTPVPSTTSSIPGRSRSVSDRTPTRASTATVSTESSARLVSESRPNATAPIDLESRINRSNLTGMATVPPAATLTVVATQGFTISDERAEIAVFTDDGALVYHDDRYQAYFDVDPVPGRSYTVEYAAAEHLYREDCEAFETVWCTRNVVERVNLSTGTITQVHSTITARVHGTRWHDVDRLNATHRVVADIDNDRVYIFDIRDGSITWQWNASSEFSRTSGGRPNDWTHVNDVEVLADGRIMVSLRNLDQVVFLRPGEGILRNWTLGADDRRAILFEQHNPDYLPRSRGGPAVLVSDSENNRVIEYHRVDGNWTPAWEWRDPRLQWPRDADRLPNGNTLVVDSHGDRVLEVAPNGSVVWTVHIGMPYDAERLGTGDESANGSAITPTRASSAGHDMTRASVSGPSDRSESTDSAVLSGVQTSPGARIVLFLKRSLPSVVVNGLLYVSPSWVHFVDLIAIFILVTDVIIWGLLEIRWSSLRVGALPRRVYEITRSR